MIQIAVNPRIPALELMGTSFFRGLSSVIVHLAYRLVVEFSEGPRR